MSNAFSFSTPIMLYKVNWLKEKPTVLGFFNTYKEAEEERERRGLTALSCGIDNGIVARFFDAGIHDEETIRNRMAVAYN